MSPGRMVSSGKRAMKWRTASAMELTWPGVPVTACASMRPWRSKTPAERAPASRPIGDEAAPHNLEVDFGKGVCGHGRAPFRQGDIYAAPPILPIPRVTGFRAVLLRDPRGARRLGPVALLGRGDGGPCRLRARLHGLRGRHDLHPG